MWRGGRWCYDIGFFFFQAEDGIRDLVRSRGLGDVYKRQPLDRPIARGTGWNSSGRLVGTPAKFAGCSGCVAPPSTLEYHSGRCLLYTSDAADERSSVDLGGRRIIKKTKKKR